MNPQKPICGIISVSLPFLCILLILSIWLFDSKGQTFFIGLAACAILSVFPGLVISGIGIVRRENHRWLCFAGIVLTLLIYPAFFTIPFHSPTSRALRVLGNGRQIYLSTFQMATDGLTAKNPALGWPGDLKANGAIATVADFANLLTRNGYLQSNDLKVFGGPGFPAYKGELKNGVLDPPFEEKNCIFKIFLVRENDPSNTVFLMSKRGALKDKGVVILRKGGDGCIYKNIDQAQGTFIYPGGATEETAENCLNPDPR